MAKDDNAHVSIEPNATRIIYASRAFTLMTNRAKVWFIDKYRNPIWKVGGAIALVLLGVLGSFFLTSVKEKRARALLIDLDTSKELTDFLEPVGARTRILVDGKEEQGLALSVYVVQYLGDEPLRVADFEGAIIGAVPAGRKIIAVQKSSNSNAPYRYEKGKFATATGESLSFQASKKNDTICEIQPLLMNPGEWFRLEIYTADQIAQGTPSPDPTADLKFITHGDVTWSCHIADVKCPADRYFDMGSGNAWDVGGRFGIINSHWMVRLVFRGGCSHEHFALGGAGKASGFYSSQGWRYIEGSGPRGNHCL